MGSGQAVRHWVLVPGSGVRIPPPQPRVAPKVTDVPSSYRIYLTSDDIIKQARADAVSAILNDPATHKVVVAGPGTGKTHTYKELLGRVESPLIFA